MPLTLKSRVASVARLDHQWRIKSGSPAFSALLGRDEAELIDRSFLDFTEAKTNWFVSLLSPDLLDADGSITQDFRIVRPTGESFWVRARILLSVGEDGGLLPNEISLMEIEDLRHSGIRQSKQVDLLDRMLSVVDSVFWASRLSDGQNLYVSPAYERIWGADCRQLELDGGSWMESIHPDDRARVQRDVRRQREAGQPFDMEYRIIRADGSVRWIWDKGMPARNMFGNVDVYIGSAQDITERKVHEIELARLQAADNIGMMAADLAHNFNNLLAIVDLAARAIGREDQPGTYADKLESIYSAVERGSEITKLLLSISSRQNLKPSYEDVNSIIKEMKPLVAASMSVNHRVLYDMTSLPCLIHIDRTGLNQALLNLIKNSREAMADGGDLLIQTRVLPSTVLAEDEESPRQFVEITIEDTGTGMTEHALRHATDPYFTTKEQGSGFGLAITNGFVKQSGGRLSFANRNGGGLMVRMVFPLAAPPEQDMHLEDWGTGPRGRNVLIVDDEPSIAQALAQLLEAEGYHASVATGFLEAKRRLEHGSFALVISDVALGAKSTGVDLALWARKSDPTVKVLLISGYASNRSAIPSDIPFISKPFSPDELLDSVRGALDVDLD